MQSRRISAGPLYVIGPSCTWIIRWLWKVTNWWCDSGGETSV